jgi:hypothetical protein
LSRAAAAAILLAVVILVYWAFLFTRQRAFLFPAPDPAGAPARPPDAEVVWLETAAGRVEAWYLPPLADLGGPAPLLVFTHGNGELIDYWPGEFRAPREWGMGVLLVEYPGYGRSEGAASEGSITDAVLAAYDWAGQRAELDAGRVVAYGRSLGGGPSLIVAHARPVAAVVLESSFTSVRAFARRMGAPAMLVRDRFDNLERVADVTVPLLIVHGAHDRIVPVAHAHALHAAQPASELVLVPCGHNDCPVPWPSIERFLRRHGVL